MRGRCDDAADGKEFWLRDAKNEDGILFSYISGVLQLFHPRFCAIRLGSCAGGVCIP
jgi:hypothetical protein